MNWLLCFVSYFIEFVQALIEGISCQTGISGEGQLRAARGSGAAHSESCEAGFIVPFIPFPAALLFLQEEVVQHDLQMSLNCSC